METPVKIPFPFEEMHDSKIEYHVTVKGVPYHGTEGALYVEPTEDGKHIVRMEFAAPGPVSNLAEVISLPLNQGQVDLIERHPYSQAIRWRLPRVR